MSLLRAVGAAAVVAACLLVPGFSPVGTSAQGRPCADSPNTPLPDLTRPYRGLEPGLFPGRRNTPPEAHLKAGTAAAGQVRPLDASGKPSADGRIILLSIGMSNTSSEFQRFIEEARGMPALNPKLSIVNGALSGADASMWASASSRPWQQLTASLGGRGRMKVSAAQVQAIWIKQAHLKTTTFPEELDAFARDLNAAIETATRRFPNLRLVYVSSRTRSGAESRRGPGEPQAYETAFAVRRLIEKRMGADGLWVSWGPYLWANGAPRSDGAQWDCNDLQKDLLHPSKSGDSKVAAQLLSFFTTDETSVPWFLDGARRSPEGALRISPSASRGPAPLTVTFAAEPGNEAFWSFGDGTTAIGARPRKTFRVAGEYTVRATMILPGGQWAAATTTIAVGADQVAGGR